MNMNGLNTCFNSVSAPTASTCLTNSINKLMYQNFVNGLINIK